MKRNKKSYVEKTENELTSKENRLINDRHNILLEVYEKTKGKKGHLRSEVFFDEIDGEKQSLSKKYNRDTNFNINFMIEFGSLTEFKKDKKTYVRWVGDKPTRQVAKESLDFAKQKKIIQKETKKVKDNQVKVFDFSPHKDNIVLFAEKYDIPTIDDPVVYFTEARVDKWEKFLNVVEEQTPVEKFVEEVVGEVDEIVEKAKKKDKKPSKDEVIVMIQEMKEKVNDTNKRICDMETKLGHMEQEFGSEKFKQVFEFVYEYYKKKKSLPDILING